MIVDTTGAARRPPAERVRAWLSSQRVFISSAMGDTREERRAAANAIREEGARPVWFEEFGRDADPEEAYLGELDSAHIYLGILKLLYGRQLATGFSAMETEYLHARERGKRIAVLAAAGASTREGHLNRFLERVRVFVTTENYRDVDDLASRTRRRLRELAAEALSPWVKLDELVFRADEITDSGESVTIRAEASDELAQRFQDLRDQRFGRTRLRLAYGARVLDGDLAGVRTTVRAAGASELVVGLERCSAPRGDGMRAGMGGLTPDELVGRGMGYQFLGEPLPESLGALASMVETGLNADDLRQCFDLPNEIAESITRLVVTEGLVGHGHAKRVVSLSLGPRSPDRNTRQIAISWDEPRTYTNVEPQRRSIEGVWRSPQGNGGRS